jgi:hypothetical protein
MSNGSKEVFRHRRFTLADDGSDSSQYAIVGHALARAAKITRSDKEGNLLSLICQDFLMNTDGGPNAVGKYLGKIEELLGVRIDVHPIIDVDQDPV